MKNEIALLKLLYSDADADESCLAMECNKLLSLLDGSQRLDYVSNAKPKDMPQLIPHLIYEDVAGAIDWLERAFGFRERKESRHVDSDGAIGHAELQVGAALSDPLIMLGPPSIHGGSPRKGVSAALYLYVDDVRRHYERASAAGAKIVTELKRQPWGDLHYQAADPEGHQWQFAQRLRPSER